MGWPPKTMALQQTTFQCGQTVAQAHTIAGIGARRKLAAGRGAPLVNTASGFFTHGASECGAAWAGVIRAAHTAGEVIHFIDQPTRYTASVVLRFVNRKINAECGAAGTTGQTGMGHGDRQWLEGADCLCYPACAQASWLAMTQRPLSEVWFPPWIWTDRVSARQ